MPRAGKTRVDQDHIGQTRYTKTGAAQENPVKLAPTWIGRKQSSFREIRTAQIHVLQIGVVEFHPNENDPSRIKKRQIAGTQAGSPATASAILKQGMFFNRSQQITLA
ncbi:MAG: hypothetical protein OSB69_05305 [Alphaproteobacteria bacterium]|nr:hypothetical protein [Alphaproteobacteria bacterium]